QPRLGSDYAILPEPRQKIVQRIARNLSNAWEVLLCPSNAIFKRQTRDIPAKLVRGRNLEPPDTSLSDWRTLCKTEQGAKVIGSSVIEIWDRLNAPAPFTRERQIERLAAKNFGLLQIPPQQLARTSIPLVGADPDQGNSIPARKLLQQFEHVAVDRQRYGLQIPHRVHMWTRVAGAGSIFVATAEQERDAVGILEFGPRLRRVVNRHRDRAMLQVPFQYASGPRALCNRRKALCPV